jgi:hypothetical protein
MPVLRRRLLDLGGGQERRLGRPGAGVREPGEHWHPLRQGRGDPRARDRRASAEVPAEAGRRPMAAHQMGPGDRGDRRPHPRDSRAGGAGCGLLARLGQVQQRDGLSLPQVRGVLGIEQCRSPGADLSFDHRRRRRQQLRLRRHDQQPERHPQCQGDLPDRRQSCRSPPGRHAARAARQGERREADGHRPALYPYRGTCRRVRAGAHRHRHRVHVGRALAHLPERLGGQGVHQRSRVRHGRGPRGGRALHPRGGRAGHRRGARSGRARRPDDGGEPAEHGDLVHGAHPVAHRQQQHPMRLDSAAGARQRRPIRRRHQHLSRPRQRPGGDPTSAFCATTRPATTG